MKTKAIKTAAVLLDAENEDPKAFVMRQEFFYYDVHVGADNHSSTDGYSVFIRSLIPPPPKTRLFRTNLLKSPVSKALIDEAVHQGLPTSDLYDLDYICQVGHADYAAYYE